MSLDHEPTAKKKKWFSLGREIHERRDYSEKTAEIIDNTILKLIKEAFNTAEEVITKQRDKLEKIAQTLLKEETLEKDKFEQLLATA